MLVAALPRALVPGHGRRQLRSVSGGRYQPWFSGMCTASCPCVFMKFLLLIFLETSIGLMIQGPDASPHISHEPPGSAAGAAVLQLLGWPGKTLPSFLRAPGGCGAVLGCVVQLLELQAGTSPPLSFNGCRLLDQNLPPFWGCCWLLTLLPCFETIGSVPG